MKARILTTGFTRHKMSPKKGFKHLGRIILRMCETIHIFDEASPDNWKTLETLVFDILKKKYGRQLKEHFDTADIPRNSEKCILIFCRNFHENLEFILQNCVRFAPRWSIAIFCSDVNINFCKDICGHQLKQIHLFSVFKGTDTENASELEYQKMLKDPRFFSILPWNSLWIVRMDCYFRRQIPDELPCLLGNPFTLSFLEKNSCTDFVNRLSTDKSDPQWITQSSFISKDPLACRQWWTSFDPRQHQDFFSPLLCINLS